MKTLLRKELRDTLRDCALAGLLGAGGLIALGRFVLDYGPPEREFDEAGKLWALFCLATGAILGFFQLRQERARGTEAYLHHRATGPGGAFAAKVVAGLLGLALILLLELGLHAAWFALVSDAAPLARWERLLDHLAVASLLPSSYGLGLWASALRRSEGTRILILVVGALSLYLLSVLASLHWDGAPQPPVLRFVIVQLLLAGVLGGLAARLQCAGGEPERPVRSRLALALVAPAVVLLGLPLALMPSALQSALCDMRLDLPHIVHDRESGELLLAAPTPRGFLPAGADGQPLADAAPLEGYTGWGYKPEHRYLTLYEPEHTPLGWSGSEPPPLRREFAGRAFDFDGSWLWLRDIGRGPRAAWIDNADGQVLALVEGPERATGMRRLGRPDGRPFSADTVPVWVTGDAPPGGADACLVDRSDATAWQLVDGPAGPELRAAPLPGGERLRDVERVHSEWRVIGGLLEPYGYSDVLVVRGEAGHWAWTGSEWTSWQREPGSVLESELPGAIRWRLRAVDGDALLPHIEVRDARDGTVRFEHDYTARSGEQWGILLATQAPTLVRPPLLALIALGQPAGAFDRTLPGPFDRLVLDPALAGGNRWWLAAGSLLGALGMANVAWRHLGPAPGDRSRRRVWTVLVAALGWPALLALVLVEPKRVPRRVPAPASERSSESLSPLIASRA